MKKLDESESKQIAGGVKTSSDLIDDYKEKVEAHCMDCIHHSTTICNNYGDFCYYYDSGDAESCALMWNVIRGCVSKTTSSLPGGFIREA